MVREIKFRAWDKKFHQLLNWDFIKDHDDPYFHEDEDYILQQYTGLKDKNGKEIYEGDIVKQTFFKETGGYFEEEESFEGHHIGEVVITASKGVCLRNPICYSLESDETFKTNQYKDVAGYRSEVIGNIYENPELLEHTS